MPKFSPFITNFTAGELSDLIKGRVDIQKYFNGVETLENFIPKPYGGAHRRPGSVFVSEVEDSSKITRMIPFQFSTSQTYAIEMGDLYMRFYKDRAQITEAAKTITGVTQADPGVVTSVAHGFANGDEVIISGVVGMTELNGKTFQVANKAADTFELTDKDGNDVDTSGYTAYVSGGEAARIYKLTTTYAEADLAAIQFVQTADLMYLVHPDYPPRVLSRTGDTSWTIADVAFVGGPFKPVNTTAVTLTPSADAGAAITVTASAATFTADHIGAFFKIKDGYVKITAFASTTSVTADVQANQDLSAGDLNTGPAATTDWAEGAWSIDEGYPSTVTFYEQRLALANSPGSPQTVWLSVNGVFTDFFPGSNADDALNYTLASDQVNAILWLSPGVVLAIGTTGSVFTLSAGTTNEALTPTNVRVQRDTSYGCQALSPKRIGNFTYYMQRNQRTLREFSFSFDIDSHIALDMTILSNHITDSKIVDMDYAQSPDNTLWCVRTDGQIATLTREIDQQVVSWARQKIAGVFGGGEAVVESVAVIAVIDGEYDEVWMIVKRTINGVTRRYVEYLHDPAIDDQEDAYFVDSGLSLDSPLTITAITKANPGVITSNSHGLSNGDKVTIRNIVGMTELNDKKFTVANSAANTFTLQDANGDDIDTTGYTTYVSGGEARKAVSTISGLDHLEGETVQVLADGAAHPDRTVSSGAITLNGNYGEVHVGLGYTSLMVTLRLEGGSALGTAQGKIKRIYEVVVRIYNSLGFQIGRVDQMDIVPFRDSSMAMDRPPSLFTGDKRVTFPQGYNKNGQMRLQQTQPLPFNIIALFPKVEVYDK